MYSDTPPSFVIPDDEPWRRRARIEFLPDLNSEGNLAHAYCDRYRKNPSADRQAALVLDVRHPECHACANRRSDGVRNHNWCYRCPAGMMHTELHIYDAAQDRDRAMILG